LDSASQISYKSVDILAIRLRLRLLLAKFSLCMRHSDLILLQV